ncbi:MAG: MBOAT family protein [Muribaculaceae bacterium]|nr:MBOAT family protein [Muribaculaceae bacterium]
MFGSLQDISMSNLLDLLLYNPNSPLVFNTGLFLILFLILIGLYNLTKRNFRISSVIVILFSLYFYYKSTYYYCFILLAICACDYVIGRLFSYTNVQWKRKILVSISVISNIGILASFKYLDLLIKTFSDPSIVSNPLAGVLTAGISFISFRSMSYIIDIYRREIEPETNFINYTFFLTFFPPLLAGPVVRAKDMLPQIKANQPATEAMIGSGFFLIMCGLIKKAVIADYLGVNFIDRIFDNPALYTGFENIMAVIGYALQIYCDFSGYSDMAIGLALLLGYKFKDNFNAPYKSQNPSEFWHRWHISLSTWLRDYLYIPLGGNRQMSIASYIWFAILLISGTYISYNLLINYENSYVQPILGVILSVSLLYLIVSSFIAPDRRKNIITSMHLFVTMLVGGLWHGASWMFVLWGAWTGMLLIVHKQIKKLYHLPEEKRNNKWRIVSNIIITFILMLVSWIFFRSPNITIVQSIFTQITTHFTAGDPNFIYTFVSSYPLITLAIISGYLMHFAPKKWTTILNDNYTKSPLIVKSIILTVILFIVIQASQSELVPFIYQQF